MSNQPPGRENEQAVTEVHDPEGADRTAELPGSSATGAYLPGAVDPPDLPQTDVVPPEPAIEGTSVYDGTGDYVPQDTGATGDYHPDPTRQPEFLATGDYHPDPTRQPGVVDLGKTDPAATGAYVPERTGGRGSSSHTAMTGATGAYDPNAPSAFPSVPPVEAGPGPESRCGRYVLKRFHAKGGMGEIWLAEDPDIGRSVALKRMLGHRPDQQHRFRVEAQVTGQLEHPGIVPVHELGNNEDGLPFYAMKFVHGRTLQKVIREYHKTKANTSEREVEEFRLLQNFISLCQTVAYAHSKGVLHRDLKPENVMLGPYGETLLLDWGIAKVKGRPDADPAANGEHNFVQLTDAGADTETVAGSIMGSPTYMSPEVAAGRNKEVDELSDVYLLGATLYEILTGKMPREGRFLSDLISKAAKEPPVPPRKIKPQISRALEAICLKAMAMRKQDRYPSALALAEDVQRFVAGEPVSAYREGFAARAWRWAKRHRTALGRMGVALVIAAGAFIGIDQYQRAEKRHEDQLKAAEDLRVQEQKKAEEKRIAIQQQAERLAELKRAEEDVAAIRTKAEEARYYAATSDAVAESSPYFDARQGEARAREALAIAAKWGTALANLPLLPDKKEAVRRNLYDLLVLLAQTRGQQPGPRASEEALAFLDEAARLRAPTSSFYRVRAGIRDRVGDPKKAQEDRRLADSVQAGATSQDYFLRGEEFRTQAAGNHDNDRKRPDWQSDPHRIELAIEQYREALNIDRDHFWAHFQLGRCLLSQRKDAEALGELGTCIALQPKEPWGYSARGAALIAQGNYHAALRDLDEAVRLRPDFRPSHLHRGIAYMNQQKFEPALAEFAAALAPPNESRLVEAAFYRGQFYSLQGEVDKALADFDRVIAEQPRLRPAFLYRARIYLAKGDTARGLADIDAYLAGRSDYDPKSPMANGLRGHQLRLLYAYIPARNRELPSSRMLAKQTLNELNQAIKRGAASADVWEDLGAMMELIGQPEEAIAAYGKGLALAPGHVKLLVKRGWANTNLEQYDKALADFVLATRRDPKHAEAHSGVGFVQVKRKKVPEAQREADLALLYGADDYTVLHNVACIYGELAQLSQAPANEEATLALLRQAVDLWRKGVWKHEGPKLDELGLIKGDEAASFKSLSNRPDYRALFVDPLGPGTGLLGGSLPSVPVPEK